MWLRLLNITGSVIGADFRKFQWVQAPIPSLSFLFPLLHPLPSHPFPLLLSLLFISLPSLEVRPPKPSYGFAGVLYYLYRLRHRVRAEPGRQRIRLHCVLENRCLWIEFLFILSFNFLWERKSELTTKSQTYMLHTQTKKYFRMTLHRPTLISAVYHCSVCEVVHCGFSASLCWF